MFEIIMDPNSIFFWLLIISIIAIAVGVISRPFSTYVKFVYPNAKFEAIGNPYLNSKNLNNISDSKSITDFKDILNTSKDYNISGKTTFEVQKSIDDNFIKTIDMMRRDSSKKMSHFFDIYLEKVDFYLIKMEIKNKVNKDIVSEKSIEKALMQKTKSFLSRLEETKKEDLPKLFKDYGFNEELVNSIENENIDFFEIDNALDRYILSKIEAVKVPYKCEKAKKRFVKINIDIINIKNLLRAKKIGYKKETINKLFIGDGQEIAKWKFEELAEAESVSELISNLEGTSYFGTLKDKIEDYNKQSSVQVLENSLDRLFLNLIKDLSTENFVTIGPTIRFLVSKEYEIKNLKIIAKSISEKISPETTKSLLIMGDKY
jgi:V/A-type H+-transporting ATPase subunit C